MTLTDVPLWNGGGNDVPADDPKLERSTLKLGVLEDKPFIIYNYTLQGKKRCSGEQTTKRLSHCTINQLECAFFGLRSKVKEHSELKTGISSFLKSDYENKWI